jgi:hypothetical protein
MSARSRIELPVKSTLALRQNFFDAANAGL